ncbi:hypothetical protein BH708_12160 [Brachybacterium sp. P6-10-X1]|nr:hypothetical protein BH708_12160 [Brachybacterium sp. P6-10-X1]
MRASSQRASAKKAQGSRIVAAARSSREESCGTELSTIAITPMKTASEDYHCAILHVNLFTSDDMSL